MRIGAFLKRGLLLNLKVKQFVANALNPIQRNASARYFVGRRVLPVLAKLRHFTGVPGSVDIGDIVASGIEGALVRFQRLQADQK